MPFHGYYPSEIAQLLCTSRQAVAELLRVARAETKIFLTEPQRLSFMQPTAALPAVDRFTNDNLSEQLRQAIYATRQGVYQPARHVEDLYIANHAELIDAPKLAHFVSCPACLEIINRLLKLPSLDERHPPDRLGPDPKAGSGQPPTKPTLLKPNCQARASLQKLERCWREVYEHDPAELRVAVNGVVLSAHKLPATERHEQALSIEPATHPLFLKIFSEQGVRLLFAHVDAPPIGAFEQEAQTVLSNGRILTARLTFGSAWPHLEISYEVGSQKSKVGREGIAAPQFLLEASPPAQGFFANLKSVISNPQFAIHWLLRPVTITILLTLLLLVGALGQKLGWWFAAPASLAPREIRPNKTTPERMPTTAPNVEASPENTAASPLPTAATSTSPVPIVATAELELEALRLLQQAKADTHEQIEVRRLSNGKLRIEGILETDARKTELLQALAALRAHPAVELDLQTVAEAAAKDSQRQRPPTSATIVEREEITETRLPVDAELRRHFSARGIGAAQMDEAIRRFAATTLAHSRQAARHAGALKNLAARFADSSALDSSARKQWRNLLLPHARSLHNEILALRASLTPIFAAAQHGEGAGISAINSDDELRRACERLAALCADSDRVLIAAFSLSSDAAPAVAVKSQNFWQNLHRGEHLAAVINQYLVHSQ